MLTNENKILIKEHTKVDFKYTYLIVETTFDDDMGNGYKLIMFYNCQRLPMSDRHNRVGYILMTNDGEVIFSGYDIGLPYDVNIYEWKDIFDMIETSLFFCSYYYDDDEYECSEKQRDWLESYGEYVYYFSMAIQEYLAKIQEYSISDSDDDEYPEFHNFTIYSEGDLLLEVTDRSSISDIAEKIQAIS